MEWVIEVFSEWKDFFLCGILVGILIMLGEIADALTRMGRKSQPRREPKPIRESQGQLRLVWRENDGLKSYTLPIQGHVIIGRAPDCDVVLNAPAVSWQHARMEVVAGSEVILVDLDSTNGTFVGSQRIGRAQVYPDDVIHIGGYNLGLVTVGDSDCRVIRK